MANFDPDAFIASYDAQPATAGVPPLLARPNAGNVPDYTSHDDVAPGQAQAVRMAIGQLMVSPGFDSKPPAEQRELIIDAVHGITRQADPRPQPAGGRALPPDPQPAGPVNTLGKLGPLPVASTARLIDYEDPTQVAARDANKAFLGAAGSMVGGGLAGTAAAAAPGVRALVNGAKLLPRMAGGAIEGAASGVGAATGGKLAQGETPTGGELAAGAGAGAALGAAIPAAAAGVNGLLRGAMNASDESLLSKLGDGATKKMRDKINEKADETVNLIRSTPALKAAYKDPASFARATTAELGNNGKALDTIYDAADKGSPFDPAKALGQLQALQQQHNSRLAGKEIATELQPTIDKLMDRATTPGAPPISSRELREEISRLQDIAFDRSAAAKSSDAQKAAARAAGVLKDALEAHVDANLPGQGDAVRKLNADQTVLARLKKAAEYQALAVPHQEGTRLSKIGKGVATAVSHAGGGAAAVHGAMTGNTAEMAAGLAAAVAPAALGAGRRAATEAVAAAGRVGVGASPETTRLAQRLATVTDRGAAASAIADHVFGGGPPATAPETRVPKTFGLPDEPGEEKKQPFGLPGAP